MDRLYLGLPAGREPESWERRARISEEDAVGGGGGWAVRKWQQVWDAWEGGDNQAVVFAHDAHDSSEALPADWAAPPPTRARPDALRAADAEPGMAALEQHRVPRAIPAYDAGCALHVHGVAAVIMAAGSGG